MTECCMHYLVCLLGLCWFCNIFNFGLHVLQNWFTHRSSSESRTRFSVHCLSTGLINYAGWTLLGCHFLFYASYSWTWFTSTYPSIENDSDTDIAFRLFSSPLPMWLSQVSWTLLSSYAVTNFLWRLVIVSYAIYWLFLSVHQWTLLQSIIPEM